MKIRSWMRVRARPLLSALGLFGAALVFSGCATTSATSATGRRHASLTAQTSEIGRVAVLPPTLVLSQLTAGGVKEQRDDWTQTACVAAREHLATIRPGRLVAVAPDEVPGAITEEMVEVQALYRAVDRNLAVFGNPMVGLPTMSGRFDFSVGDVDRLCSALGADALLLIYGEDDYFTGDRKALVALGVVASAFTGVYVQPASGAEHISAALVARDGTLLWHDVLGAGRIADLRKPEGMRDTLNALLRSMPELSGPQP